MRRLTNTLITACCCLLLFQTGCSSDTEPNAPLENAKVDQTPDTTVTITTPADPEPITRGDQAPVVNPPVVTPPPVIPPPFVGGGGGGGGSQGAEKPARTGNPDNDPLADFESICDDGIDNDGDGFIDCLDSDCSDKPCTDLNGCTVGDVCTDEVCVGSPRNCEEEIGNECSIDVCEQIEGTDNGYRCVSDFDESQADFGDCTPTENCSDPNPDGSCPVGAIIDQCIVGQCAIVPPVNGGPATFECIPAELVDLSEEDFAGGCKDLNSCTADFCVDGVCGYAELDGTSCNDGDDCTTMDTCVMGDCVGMDVPNTCETDADCAKGTVCTSTPGACQLPPPGTSVVGADCFDTEDCDVGEICVGAVLGSCTCNDGNDCTVEDTCDDGECVGDVPVTPPATCSDGNECTTDVCVGPVCVSTPTTGECDDENGCTTVDLCTGGVCTGAPDNSLCEEDICEECICDVEFGCLCDLITGPSDEECSILLTSLSLSADLLTALNELGIDLNCDVGVNACREGELGACFLSDVFVATCSAASLNEACDTTVFTLETNAEVVSDLCAELSLLDTP